MNKSLSALFLVAVLPAVACNGGQSGGEFGGNEGTGGGPTNTEGDACDETSSPLALDEASPLGFTPDAILALAEGTHEASLTYDPKGQGTFELTPDSASTDLTLTITAQGGAAFVDSEPPESSGGEGPAIELGFMCDDYVTIDVTVGIATADGAFDEELEGQLVARSATETTLSVPLDLEALSGTFGVTVFEPEGGEPVQTGLSATLATGVFVGSIQGTIQKMGPEVAMAMGALYAGWGYGECDDGYAPVDPDAAGAPSPAGILDAVNSPSPLAITWGDGTATELSVRATSSSSLCRALESTSLDGSGEGYLLTGEVELETSDGRLSTTQAVAIQATADDEGTPATLSLRFTDIPMVAPAAFESTYGLSDVDLGEATEAYLALQLEYAADGDVEGALTVLGVPPNDCVPTPNSACGSPGPEPIEVAPISE